MDLRKLRQPTGAFIVVQAFTRRRSWISCRMKRSCFSTVAAAVVGAVTPIADGSARGFVPMKRAFEEGQGLLRLTAV
jgi:hypothetical protein